MVAYEFYLNDSEGNKNLIGILPERRKVSKRITQKSILRWGRMLLYDTADRRSFFYKRVTINEYTGKLFRFGPSLKTY
jgi:hypothetical protein